jgi:hypothetical protein
MRALAGGPDLATVSDTDVQRVPISGSRSNRQTEGGLYANHPVGKMHPFGSIRNPFSYVVTPRAPCDLRMTGN